MILPLLAPLIGMLAPGLFSSMGLSMAPWLASGLGSGLASLAITRDPKQALMSGLLSGGMGALSGGIGNLMNGASNTALTAAEGAAPSIINASAPMAVAEGAGNLANFGIPAAAANVVSNPAMDAAALAATKGVTGAGAGGLSGLLSYARAHPMMSMGALGMLGSMLPNEAPVQDEENPDIPEAFPTGPGPHAGYNASAPVMGGNVPPAEYWTHYGRPSATSLPQGTSGEWQFFPDNRLTPQTPPTTGGGRGGGGGGGGHPSVLDTLWGDDPENAWQRMILRMRHNFATGGLVVGPGGPTEDRVQAIGPGNMPIRLSAGEYVMPAAAVQAAGGPGAMDKMRAKLVKMQNGGSVSTAIHNAQERVRDRLTPDEEFTEQEAAPRRRFVLEGEGGNFVDELPLEYQVSGRDRQRRREGDVNASEGLSAAVDRDSVTVKGRWRTRVPQ